MQSNGTGKMTQRGKAMKLMMVDVRKAHLNAKCNRDDVYVALPEEAKAGLGMCGRLLRWLYGMRGAAQGWELEFCKKLESVGFARGKSSPVVLYRESDETSLTIDRGFMAHAAHCYDFQRTTAPASQRWTYHRYPNCE